MHPAYEPDSFIENSINSDFRVMNTRLSDLPCTLAYRVVAQFLLYGNVHAVVCSLFLMAEKVGQFVEEQLF